MDQDKIKYVGPFSQVVTMDDLPANGPLSDDQLIIHNNAYIRIKNGLVDNIIEEGDLKYVNERAIEKVDGPAVCLPGFIDAHTHLCFAGSRAKDYAMRNSGKSYLEIAKEGGGILNTVNQVRIATESELVEGVINRAMRHLKSGVTTIEVKSGYGLNVFDEMKMLEAIRSADEVVPADLVPTCLAAHTVPPEFEGQNEAYLDFIIDRLLPLVKDRELSERVDIFIEEGAFTVEQGRNYLLKARDLGFDLVVHADQFTVGGSDLAVEMGAISADHLEASGKLQIQKITTSTTIAVALPGASMGLGCGFTPARSILDQGGCLAIASDWNPGSAPMGHMLLQASVLGTFEKLSNAEVLAGITSRAASALNLADRGVIKVGNKADFAIFPVSDYREILYLQGMLKPSMVIKDGELVN